MHVSSQRIDAFLSKDEVDVKAISRIKSTESKERMPWRNAEMQNDPKLNILGEDDQMIMNRIIDIEMENASFSWIHDGKGGKISGFLIFEYVATL